MAGPGRPGPVPLPIEHGTTAGRSQHKRRGEVPCVLCKAARAAHDRELAARHRAEDAALREEVRRLRAIVAQLRAGRTR